MRSELDAELIRLNQAVTDAIATRTAWMDAHMADYASYPIGTELFDLRTGRRLGIVSKHYRYWGGRDPQYDTSMSVDYELEIGPHMFDNTSRFGGSVWPGSREELIEHHRRSADLLALAHQEPR